MSKKSKKVFVFSDTHLLGRTSFMYECLGRNPDKFENWKLKKKLLNKLLQQMKEADIVVMNGDIFELTYSIYLLQKDIKPKKAKHEAADEALNMLRSWLENELQGKQVYFTRGNHENNDSFWDGLKKLEEDFDGRKGCAKFIRKKHLKKLGNCLFIHGDKETGYNILDRWETTLAEHPSCYRELEMLNYEWEQVFQKQREKNYDPESTCQQIIKSIQQNKDIAEKHPFLLAEMDHIVFSHTHIPFKNHTVTVKVKNRDGETIEKKITFHNTGAATNHGKGGFINFDIEEKENGKLGKANNFKYADPFETERKEETAGRRFG